MELELDRKNSIIAIGLILCLLIGGAVVAQEEAVTYDTGGIPLGPVNCSVELGVIAMRDGVVVNSPILNSPLYLEGVEVTELGFSVKVFASGTDVDWATFTATVVLEVNGQGLQTWDWTILDFVPVAGGYEAFGSHTIDELDYLVGTTPTRTENGINYFEIAATVNVDASIQDIKDNTISDSVLVDNTWELSDSLGASPDPKPVPEFTTFPTDKTVDHEAAFTFSWAATDDNPATYKITSYYPDGGLQTVASGSWTSGQDLSYTGDATYINLADPAAGVTVSFVCTVYDDDGQSMFSSTKLHVGPMDTTPPDPITWSKFTSSPEAGTYPAGTYEIFITYKPVALYTPDRWDFYINGVQKQSDTWDGQDVPIFVTQQIEADGTYNLKLTVYDTDGHSESYTVTFRGEAEETTGLTELDGIPNLPFVIEGLGEGGTATVLAILVIVPIVWWYRRRMKNET